MKPLKQTIGAFLLLLLFLPMLGVLTTDARAQGIKIGYTDPDAIIVNMKDYQAIRKQLQTEFETSQQALQSLAADFQDRVEKYQKQQPLLTPERRAEREQELAQLQSEIQNSAAQKDQELAEREGVLMKPLLDKVQDAIDEVAKAKLLDIVMRAPALLYVNDKTVIDITPDVARKLGLEVPDTASK